MMGKRSAKLPEPSLALTGAVALAIVAVCVAVAVAMRGSLTDYNANPDAMAGLPFEVRPVTQELLDYEADQEELDSAELVVLARCHGEGTYVYQSFLRELEVVGVIRGQGVEPGDALWTYDNLSIAEPLNYTGKGQFSSERVVSPAGLGPNARGAMPLHDGIEYLVFLNRKELGSPSDEPRYVQVHSAYAHVAVDGAYRSGRVGVFSLGEDGSCETIPLSETRNLEMAVSSEEAARVYLQTCGKVLGSVGLAAE